MGRRGQRAESEGASCSQKHWDPSTAAPRSGTLFSTKSLQNHSTEMLTHCPPTSVLWLHLECPWQRRFRHFQKRMNDLWKQSKQTPSERCYQSYRGSHRLQNPPRSLWPRSDKDLRKATVRNSGRFQLTTQLLLQGFLSKQIFRLWRHTELSPCYSKSCSTLLRLSNSPVRRNS